MAFSTFVFDTLDVSTRLGRYVLQEVFGRRGTGGAIAGTLATIGLPLWLVAFSEPGMWRRFWTLFGASNQLLAALTLLSVTLWLFRTGRRTAFTLVPMLFVLGITLWALGQLAWANLRTTAGMDGALVNGVAAVALVSLALYLLFRAVRTVTAG
jgi:carbon starvation protein